MAEQPEDEEDLVLKQLEQEVKEVRDQLAQLERDEKDLTKSAESIDDKRQTLIEGTRLKLYRLTTRQQELEEQARAAKTRREELESVLEGTWQPPVPEETPGIPPREAFTTEPPPAPPATADSAPEEVVTPPARPAPTPGPVRAVQPEPVSRVEPEQGRESSDWHVYPDEDDEPLEPEIWIPGSTVSPEPETDQHPFPARSPATASTSPLRERSQDQPSEEEGTVARIRPITHRTPRVPQWREPPEPTGTDGPRPAPGRRTTQHDRRTQTLPRLHPWQLASSSWTPRVKWYRASLYFVAFWAGLIIDTNIDLFRTHGVGRFFVSIVVIGLLIAVAHRYGGDFANWMDERHNRRVARKRERRSQQQQNP